MSTLSPGTRIGDKFRLERALAQGGMGSVWVAHNDQLGIRVAVKLMSATSFSSPELVARFEREARSAAKLQSQHVVQVFEHGVHDGLPYIVMELLEGEDLRACFKREGRLSAQRTARILGDVCKALRRAHELGIVHRDLKPANIFLARRDDEEITKVLDFGIAKSLTSDGEDGITQTGALVGTPHYMSPEQARRTTGQIDHRSDLWAVGVIAFRALTGRLPYGGTDVIDVLMRICSEPLPLASSIAPDLGPEVDNFFARALARDPDARFQSARELADALAVLAGRASTFDAGPVSVAPATPRPEVYTPAAAAYTTASSPLAPAAPAAPASPGPMLSPRDQRTMFLGSGPAPVAAPRALPEPPPPQVLPQRGGPGAEPGLSRPHAAAPSVRQSGPLTPIPQPAMTALPSQEPPGTIAAAGPVEAPARQPVRSTPTWLAWVAALAALVVVAIAIWALTVGPLR